jgi:hypothetical protein
MGVSKTIAEAELGYDWHRGPISDAHLPLLKDKPLMILQRKRLLVGCVLRDHTNYYAVQKINGDEFVNVGNDCIAYKVMKP